MRFLGVFSGFFIAFFVLNTSPAASKGLDFLKLPKGFEIEIWAEVPGARTLVISPDGRHLYVGTRS